MSGYKPPCPPPFRQSKERAFSVFLNPHAILMIASNFVLCFNGGMYIRKAAIGSLLPSVVLVLVLSSCGATARIQTAPPAPTAVNASAILPPATTPSAVGICTEQMQFGADGNASPILCANGAVNSVAWRYFQSMSPNVFALGEYATQSQVASAVSKMELPIPDAESAYCLAKAYYGWQFGISLDPANRILPQNNCASDIPHFP